MAICNFTATVSIRRFAMPLMMFDVLTRRDWLAGKCISVWVKATCGMNHGL
ncbi:hypothetical protein [Pluralibacter gergoviae]|uniref:hypothetical protein n=1 Tax=Pluralibacter gergoviae TaxID=61647 RepID=UPI000A4C9939|nr:hypothetical protein [Pluralibacter gergoviae]